jgi:hypothetical protein
VENPPGNQLNFSGSLCQVLVGTSPIFLFDVIAHIVFIECSEINY